jgi:hypothetical protein
MIPPYFCNCLPFKQDLAFYLYKLQFPLRYICRMICIKFEIGLLVLKKIFKDFFPNINTCKNDFPHCGPARPRGTMICTNLNFHYIRKLLCKSELFWLSDSC